MLCSSVPVRPRARVDGHAPLLGGRSIPPQTYVFSGSIPPQTICCKHFLSTKMHPRRGRRRDGRLEVCPLRPGQCDRSAHFIAITFRERVCSHGQMSKHPASTIEQCGPTRIMRFYRPCRLNNSHNHAVTYSSLQAYAKNPGAYSLKSLAAGEGDNSVHRTRAPLWGAARTHRSPAPPIKLL